MYSNWSPRGMVKEIGKGQKVVVGTTEGRPQLTKITEGSPLFHNLKLMSDVTPCDYALNATQNFVGLASLDHWQDLYTHF